MRDYYMGNEVEIEELPLGSLPPAETPPYGVLMTELGHDGSSRKIRFTAVRDSLGIVRKSRLVIGETPARAYDPGQENLTPFVPVGNQRMEASSIDQAVPFLRQQNASMGDSRLNLPPGTAVRLVNSPHMGQQQPAAPMPAQPQDTPLPVSVEPDAAQTEPGATPSLPDCTRALQLPDGAIIQPDDSITLKELCSLLPYISKYVEQAESRDQSQGLIRPGGPIPLSNPAMRGVPSFGPAGGSFGGGGGGGGGSPPGAGPIGVVNSPTPIGAGQGTQGPPGPAGPAGPGSAISGVAKTDGNVLNVGPMSVVPGTTFTITVGGDGKVVLSFSFELSPQLGFASIYDVFAGVEVDGTQYQLWRNSEQQGAGDDKVLALSASGVLILTLSAGDHTISLLYGDQPGLNHFYLVAQPNEPASIVAQYSS